MSFPLALSLISMVLSIGAIAAWWRARHHYRIARSTWLRGRPQFGVHRVIPMRDAEHGDVLIEMVVLDVSRDRGVVTATMQDKGSFEHERRASVFG